MQVTLQEQRLWLNQQQGFCWQARDQERREFDAEVQALKHRLQQVEVDSWIVGVMIVFMVMLCSTALLLVVMNLAIASLWMVVAGYGWICFWLVVVYSQGLVSDLCSYLLLLAPCANRRCKIPMAKLVLKWRRCRTH